MVDETLGVIQRWRLRDEDVNVLLIMAVKQDGDSKSHLGTAQGTAGGVALTQAQCQELGHKGIEEDAIEKQG